VMIRGIKGRRRIKEGNRGMNGSGTGGDGKKMEIVRSGRWRKERDGMLRREDGMEVETEIEEGGGVECW